MAGTVNISRELWDDTAFADDVFSEREAWVWMISEASWKPRTKRVGDYIVDLGRGQLAHSTRFMAETWKWTHSKARRYLERLEKLKLISRETGTGVSVVTICNYDIYQNKPQATGTGPAQDRHRTGTNENKGEIRGKEEIDGGGEAQAREIEIIEPKTDREKILTAIGVDPVSGLTGHGGRMIGTRADMQRVTRWSELGLTIEDQCAVIREVMAKRNGQGPPNGFKFFDKPMERLAGEKLAPQLEPINLPQRPTGAVNGKSSREQFDIAHREYARRISEGTIERGPDPSDPFAR